MQCFHSHDWVKFVQLQPIEASVSRPDQLFWPMRRLNKTPMPTFACRRPSDSRASFGRRILNNNVHLKRDLAVDTQKGLPCGMALNAYAVPALSIGKMPGSFRVVFGSCLMPNVSLVLATERFCSLLDKILRMSIGSFSSYD